MPISSLHRIGLGLTALALSLGSLAQEAQIRKNLTQRFPDIGTISEVSKSAMPGLYEVRVDGTEVYYTDAQGDYMLVGNLYDTKQRRNLTKERVDKLTSIKFEDLPFKDAFTIVRGTGERKLAVFEDPNCGYCKRFERDLQTINNVTIYMFLYPILGADSSEKAKAIWCAKDRGQVWQNWMVHEKAIPNSIQMCDTDAIKRNVELGRVHKLSGTPTMIFADGTRVPGAIDAKEIEKHLADAKS